MKTGMSNKKRKKVKKSIVKHLKIVFISDIIILMKIFKK